MVEVGDELASRERQAVVIRARLLTKILGAVDETNAAVVVRADERFGVVRARIADDDVFPILITLTAHAVDRIPKYVAAIVRSRDDRDAWHDVRSCRRL